MYTCQSALEWDNDYFLKTMLVKWVNCQLAEKTEVFEQILTPRFFDRYSDTKKYYTYNQIATANPLIEKNIETVLLCLKDKGLKVPKPELKKLIIEGLVLQKTIRDYNVQEEIYPLLIHCEQVKQSCMRQITRLKKDPELTKNNWNSDHRLPPFLRSPEAFEQWFEAKKQIKEFSELKRLFHIFL